MAAGLHDVTLERIYVINDFYYLIYILDSPNNVDDVYNTKVNQLITDGMKLLGPPLGDGSIIYRTQDSVITAGYSELYKTTPNSITTIEDINNEITQKGGGWISYSDANNNKHFCIVNDNGIIYDIDLTAISGCTESIYDIASN